MKNRKNLLIGVVAVVALLAIYFVYDFLVFVSTDNAQVEAPTVLMAARVTGYITEVRVQEGSVVKKGELLIQIDQRDYKNHLTEVKAELAAVESRRQDAEHTYRRTVELFSKTAVSQSQMDSATAAYQETKSKYDSIVAQVDQAQLNLDNTSIIAPGDGFIARKSAELGQLATPGVPLLGFVDATDRWITANFKETEIDGVNPGKDVEITVDAISGRSFKGKVESLSSATGATFSLIPPDNATGNFTKVVQRVPVRIRFEGLKADDYAVLRSGLSAVVKVHKH